MSTIYFDQNGQKIESEYVVTYNGKTELLDDCVWVESIGHFALFSEVVAGENGFELRKKEYQSFKGRSIDFSQVVEIYKNLHNGLWSVRQHGLVVAHIESFMMRQVFFKVSQVGRLKVIREKRKNVHAFVCGILDESKINFMQNHKEKLDFHAELVQASKLYYNPYKTDHFMIKQARLGNYSLHCSKKCVHSTLFLIGGPSGIAAIL